MAGLISLAVLALLPVQTNTRLTESWTSSPPGGDSGMRALGFIVIAVSTWLYAEDPSALSESAQRAAQAQRYEEAERLWRKAIDTSPRYFPALFNLGLFFFSRKQFNDAVPWLERAAEVSPQDFNTQYLRGASYQALERRDDALRAWRIALKLNPTHARLLQIMVVEYGKGRYFQEAADVARRALELAPSDVNAYYLAIKSLQDAGHIRKHSRLPVGL